MLVCCNQKVQHAEGHLDFGGQLEVGAIEIQTETDLSLHIILVQLYQHFVGAFGLFFLVGNQVQTVLYTANDVDAYIVHSGGFEFEQQGQIQIYRLNASLFVVFSDVVGELIGEHSFSEG